MTCGSYDRHTERGAADLAARDANPRTDRPPRAGRAPSSRAMTECAHRQTVRRRGLRGALVNADSGSGVSLARGVPGSPAFAPSAPAGGVLFAGELQRKGRVAASPGVAKAGLV